MRGWCGVWRLRLLENGLGQVLLLQESFGCQGLEIVELGQGVEIRSGKGARGSHASCQVGVCRKGVPGRGPLKIKLARIHHWEANLGIKIKLVLYDCGDIRSFTFSGPGKGILMGLRKTGLRGPAGWWPGPASDPWPPCPANWPPERSRGCLPPGPRSQLYRPPSSSCRLLLYASLSFSI